MASRQAVQAGAAYVELQLRRSAFENGLTRAQASLESFASRFIRIGAGLSLFGVGTLSSLSLATQRFADFDRNLRSIAASAGVAFSEVTNLGRLFRSLAQTSPFTLSEISETGVRLARGGFDIPEIEKAIDQVTFLATATGSDLVTSTDVAIKVLRGFNIEASETARVTDVLAVTANKSAQNLIDLFESIKLVSASGAEATDEFERMVDASQNLEDVAAALGVLADAGLTGSIAGTSLRRITTNLAVKADEIKELLGVDVVDSQGNIINFIDALERMDIALTKVSGKEKESILNDIFEVRGKEAAKILGTRVRAVRELRDQLLEIGAAERIARSIDEGIGGSIRRVISAFDEFILQVGEALNELQFFVDAIALAVNNASNFVGRNRELVQVFAVLALGIASVGGSLLGVGLSLSLAAFAFRGFVLGAESVRAVTDSMVRALQGAIGVAGRFARGVTTAIGGLLALPFRALATAGLTFFRLAAAFQLVAAQAAIAAARTTTLTTQWLASRAAALAASVAAAGYTAALFAQGVASRALAVAQGISTASVAAFTVVAQAGSFAAAQYAASFTLAAQGMRLLGGAFALVGNAMVQTVAMMVGALGFTRLQYAAFAIFLVEKFVNSILDGLRALGQGALRAFGAIGKALSPVLDAIGQVAARSASAAVSFIEPWIRAAAAFGVRVARAILLHLASIVQQINTSLLLGAGRALTATGQNMLIMNQAVLRLAQSMATALVSSISLVISVVARMALSFGISTAAVQAATARLIATLGGAGLLTRLTQSFAQGLGMMSQAVDILRRNLLAAPTALRIFAAGIAVIGSAVSQTLTAFGRGLIVFVGDLSASRRALTTAFSAMGNSLSAFNARLFATASVMANAFASAIALFVSLLARAALAVGINAAFVEASVARIVAALGANLIGRLTLSFFSGLLLMADGLRILRSNLLLAPAALRTFGQGVGIVFATVTGVLGTLFSTLLSIAANFAVALKGISTTFAAASGVIIATSRSLATVNTAVITAQAGFSTLQLAILALARFLATAFVGALSLVITILANLALQLGVSAAAVQAAIGRMAAVFGGQLVNALTIVFARAIFQAIQGLTLLTAAFLEFLAATSAVLIKFAQVAAARFALFSLAAAQSAASFLAHWARVATIFVASLVPQITGAVAAMTASLLSSMAVIGASIATALLGAIGSALVAVATFTVPVIASVAAITAVLGGLFFIGKAIYDNWAELRALLQTVFDPVYKAVSFLGGVFADAFGEFFGTLQSVFGPLSEVFGEVGTAASQLFENLRSLAAQFFGIGNAAQQGTATAADAMNSFKALVRNVVNAIAETFYLIRDSWELIVLSLRLAWIRTMIVLGNAFLTFLSVLNTGFKVVSDLAAAWLSSLRSVTGVFRQILNAYEPVLASMSLLTNEFVSLLVESFKLAGVEIVRVFEIVGNAIFDAIVSGVNQGIIAFNGFVAGLNAINKNFLGLQAIDPVGVNAGIEQARAGFGQLAADAKAAFDGIEPPQIDFKGLADGALDEIDKAILAIDQLIEQARQGGDGAVALGAAALDGLKADADRLEGIKQQLIAQIEEDRKFRELQRNAAQGALARARNKVTGVAGTFSAVSAQRLGGGATSVVKQQLDVLRDIRKRAIEQNKAEAADRRKQINDRLRIIQEFRRGVDVNVKNIGVV